MNRRKVFGLLAIMVIVASIGSVAAFGEKFFGMDPESGNAIVSAIKANDFNAWKEAMSAQLTEDNFKKLVQRDQTMSQRHENMSEKQGTMFSGRQALNAEMNKAIKEGNYDAWKTAAVNSKSPLVSKITNKDEFNLLVQLYQAKQDGNYTEVKELSQQLGLPGVSGKNKMSGHFGRGGMI
jgi:hypothetical protein